MSRKKRRGSRRRSKRKMVYLNTNISIRAVSPHEKRHGDTLIFLWNLKRHRFKLATSSLLWIERLRPDTRRRIRSFFNTIGVKTFHVDIRRLRVASDRFIEERGLAESRRMDVMHLLAARSIGARYIAGLDRFYRRYARYFSLKYINFYTGVPVGDESGGSSGGGEGTGREEEEEDT